VAVVTGFRGVFFADEDEESLGKQPPVFKTLVFP
jgi:hypothetical protein